MRFRLRAVALNIAKRRFSFETLERFVELISFNKYNMLILQISDTNRFAVETEMVKPEGALSIKDQERLAQLCEQRKIGVVIRVPLPDRADHLLHLVDDRQKKKKPCLNTFRSDMCIREKGDIDAVLVALDEIAKRFRTRVVQLFTRTDCFSDPRLHEYRFDTLVKKINSWMALGNRQMIVDSDVCSLIDKIPPNSIVVSRSGPVEGTKTLGEIQIHKAPDPLSLFYRMEESKHDGMIAEIDTCLIDESCLFSAISPTVQLVGQVWNDSEIDKTDVLRSLNIKEEGFSVLTVSDRGPRCIEEATPDTDLSHGYHHLTCFTRDMIDLLEFSEQEEYKKELLSAGRRIMNRDLSYFFDHEYPIDRVRYRTLEEIKTCLDDHIGCSYRRGNGLLYVLKFVSKQIKR